MPKKKRKKKLELPEMARDMLPAIGFAGGTAGIGIIGGAIDPIMPAGVGNPLTAASGTLSHFVAPVTAITAGGIVLKQVKGFVPKKKKRKGGKR